MFMSLGCQADLNSHCGLWAGFGECEKNALWMIPNCCVSCKYHQAPKGIYSYFSFRRRDLLHFRSGRGMGRGERKALGGWGGGGGEESKRAPGML